jgi:hypothetical protein
MNHYERKGIVIRCTRPRVAYGREDWSCLVLYKTTNKGYVFTKKIWVFTDRPYAIGEDIEFTQLKTWEDRRAP